MLYGSTSPAQFLEFCRFPMIRNTVGDMPGLRIISTIGRDDAWLYSYALITPKCILFQQPL